MTISKEAKKRIKGNVKAHAELMKVFNIGERGVIKMIDRDDCRLTIPPAVSAIKQITGLTEKQILA